MMTMSRRLRVGARHCSMYARKMGPFIAPSITKGATIPSWRKPATKVIVFQCPCGTDAINRSPRGQRPLSRTIIVLVAVSSINTSRAGSSMPCSRIQRRRARATSARFCSAACRLFFKGNLVAFEEAPHRGTTAGNPALVHDGHHLVQGQVRLLCDKPKQLVRILLQRRDASAARFGRAVPGLVKTLCPLHRCTGADVKLFGRLAPRTTTLDLRYHPGANVFG